MTDPKTKSSIEGFASALTYVMYIGFGAAFVTFVAYSLHFTIGLPLPLSSDGATWGQFGDYIGGILNPIVALCALILLAAGVLLQRQTLVAAKEELAALKRTAELDRITSQFSSFISLFADLKQREPHLKTMRNAADNILAILKDAPGERRADGLKEWLSYSAQPREMTLRLATTIKTLLANADISVKERSNYMQVLQALMTTHDGIVLLCADGMGVLSDADRQLVIHDRLIDYMDVEIRRRIQAAFADRAAGQW